MLKPAYVLLATGEVFNGYSYGARSAVIDELVFNTSHFGYEEMLTDPSYQGQILLLTTAHVGNVGLNHQDNQSSCIQVSALLCRNFSTHYSSWRANYSLQTQLQHIPVIAGLDTRALTLSIRKSGVQYALVVTNDLPLEEAKVMLANHVCKSRKNLAESVYSKKSGTIIIIDCGVKTGIIDAFAIYGLEVTVVPASISWLELNTLHPIGVVFSNGPGDPHDYPEVIALAKQVLQAKMPVLGICLGQQILALASGGTIVKMKFGQHGANHPLYCERSKRIMISSQNHNFMVDETTLPDMWYVTHRSLFDGSVAGIAHRSQPAWALQGHPEGSPGPHDCQGIFNNFINGVIACRNYHISQAC